MADNLSTLGYGTEKEGEGIGKTPEQTKANMWSALAGTYGGANEYLLGLPDFLVKKVLPSDAYQDFKKFREEHRTAENVGAGLGLGASIVGPGVIVKGATKAAKALKEAPTFISKLANIGANVVKDPAIQGLGRAGFESAMDVGSGEITPAEGLAKAAIGGTLGAVGGKVAEKVLKSPNISNALIAKSEKAAETPLNLKLARAGLTQADINTGLMQIQMKASKDARDKIAIIKKDPSIPKAEKDLLIADAKKEAERLDKSTKEEAIDPIKDAVENIIDTFALKDPDALAKFGGRSLDDIKMALLASTAGKSDVDIEGLMRAAEAIKNVSYRDKMGDLAEAANIGKKVETKVEDAVKKGLLGAAVGAGTGGGLAALPDLLSGNETNIDPLAVGAGALTGAFGPKAIGKIAGSVPAITAASKVAAPVLKKMGTEALGAGGVARAGAGIGQAVDLSPEAEKVVEETKPSNVNMDVWLDKLDEIAYNAYKASGSKASYNDWFNENVKVIAPNLDPEEIARSESGILSPRDREAILRDYRAKKQMSNVDWKHMFSNRSLLEKYLGESEAGKKATAEEERLYKFILSPNTTDAQKVAGVVSPALRTQFNKDLKVIKESGVSTEEKKAAFLQLLKDYYGYNPDYLGRLGL